MADRSRKEDDTLLLVFSTEKPIGAVDIADLLRDLSNDYKRVTGGQLVLARYETGSSWIYLRDAIAVAGSMAGALNDVTLSVQNMRTFVKALIDGFPSASTPPVPQSQVEKVAKSVARIAKIAAENGAYINLEYLKDEKEGVESYTFHMNNQRARGLHAEHGQSAAPKKSVRASVRRINPLTEMPRVTDRQIAMGISSDDLVEAIVVALKSGGGMHMLPSLVSDLEAAGRHDIARAVRQHL